MKKWSQMLPCSLFLAAAVLLGTSQPLPAQAAPAISQQQVKRPVANAALDFDLVNATGYDIAQVYVGESDDEEWSDGLLEDTLSNGQTLHIRFRPDIESVYWDLCIEWYEDEDADEVYWKNIKLDEVSRITLYYDKKSGKTSAKME